MQNEAIPQDGTKVKGYRKLTDGEIERMNRLKDASRHFCSLIATESDLLRAQLNGPDMLSQDQAQECNDALRWLAIARTDMQTACMAACRAVARPDADC